MLCNNNTPDVGKNPARLQLISHSYAGGDYLSNIALVDQEGRQLYADEFFLNDWGARHRFVKAVHSQNHGVSPAELEAGLLQLLEELEDAEINGLDYLRLNSKGAVSGVDREALVWDLMKRYSFKTFAGTTRDEILVYQGGVYLKRGEEVIRRECERRVPTAYLTTHEVNEVAGHIARSTYVERSQVDADPNIVNLKNGLLNLITGECTPHTPDFFSTVQLPLVYDPEAKCPQIEEFLKQILRPEDKDPVLELIGYCLVPEYTMQQAFLFLGSGANGKSTLLSLMAAFLGKENVCSVSPQQAETSPFILATLYGKLLNAVGDMPSTPPQEGWTRFKQLTGGDIITAQRKYLEPINFVNHAKLVYSTQKPPKIGASDNSLAFWRRWVIVNFPRTFQGEACDRDILAKLTTEQELSGLVNLALAGLKRLRAQGHFSSTTTIDEIMEHWDLAADPVKVFVSLYCVADFSFAVERSKLYRAYCQFCQKRNIPTECDANFGKSLREVPGLTIRDERHREGGVEVRYYKGLKLNTDGEGLLEGKEDGAK